MFSRLRVLIFTLFLALMALFSWLAPASQAAGEPPTPSAVELSPAEWANIQAQLPHQPTAPQSVDASQVATLTAAVSANGYMFGYTVDVYGDIAVVGAPKVDIDGDLDVGMVYIFYRNFGSGGIDNWALVKNFTAPDSEAGDEFGSAVAIYGDTIIVGAPRADITAGDNRGAAYIFARNRDGINVWGQVAVLTNNGTSTTNINFGRAVDIHGDTAIVGAKELAYIFARNKGGADVWGYVNPAVTSPHSLDFGASVAIYGDTAVVGAPDTETSGESPTGSAYVYYRNDNGVDGWGLRTQISASDRWSGDKFGSSVAIEQDTIVVGAMNDDVNGNLNQGSAYVYQRNLGGINAWGEVAHLVVNGNDNHEFGVSVAIDQDLIAVGARKMMANGAEEGAVYLFERNFGEADAWNLIEMVQAQTSPPVLPQDSRWFGHSVALHNGTLVGGSPAWGSDSGYAYVFYVAADEWQEIAKPVAPDGLAGDQLGYALAIHNDTLVVGAHTADPAGTDSGTAYVFERNSTGANEWGLVAILTPTDGLAGDHFGRSVTIFDDTIAVGAPDKNSSTGGVYLFLRNSGGADNWGQYKMFNGTAPGQKYGAAVSLSGDILAIGAPNAAGVGGVTLLERNVGGLDNWGLLKQLTVGATGDQFGYAVALDIDTLVVGSPYADPAAVTDAGLAYLFERNTNVADNWGQVKQLEPASAAANNHFGWSVSLSEDTAVVGVPDLDVNTQTDAGGAVIFTRNVGGANNWGLRTTLTDSSGLANDRLGFAVSVWIDKVALGAPRRQVGSNVNQGSVLIFERNQGGLDAWGLQHRLTASDGAAEDRLGFSVALNTYHLAAGALNANINTQDNQGAAYLYRWDNESHTLSVALGGNQTGQVTSNPAGIVCGEVCTAAYVPGTVVTLTAVADSGSSLTGWSGACSGSQLTCVVTLTANTQVTATFMRHLPPLNKLLTVVKEGSGQGLVTSDPAGINCGSDCTNTYSDGLLVTLTATADPNSEFIGWGGACVGTGLCVVQMSFDYTVTAEFTQTELITYSLTVHQAGTGSGVVTSTPEGIDCGATCTAQYLAGTVVTLTATPATTNTYFVGWSGACAGVGPCEVTLNANSEITATFDELATNTFPLSVVLAGTGQGSVSSSPAGINCGVDCTETYSTGTVVTLTATSSPTSTFAGWSGGGCSGTAACVVTVNSATQVTATFDELAINTFPLSVVLAGTGQGSVSSSPAGISCGLDCTETYSAGTVVTLTATSSPTSTFAGWSGGGCSGTAACVVTVNSATQVTATFTLMGSEYQLFLPIVRRP